MFSEAYSGTYAEQVVWFAGVADGMVHVTLYDTNKDNIFYDYMTTVSGQDDFNKQLDVMCKEYIKRFIHVPLIEKETENTQIPK
jgi:hypothetical protein